MVCSRQACRNSIFPTAAMSRFQPCIGQTFPRSSPEAAGLQLTSAVSRMCLEVLRYCCQAAWSQPRSAIADWSCSCKPKHAFDLSESIWVGDGSRYIYIFKQLNQIQHNSTHIDINGSDFVSRTWGLSFQAASSWACQDFKWGNHLQTSSYHVAQPAKSHPLVKLQQVLQVWLSSWIHSFALAIARPVIFFTSDINKPELFRSETSEKKSWVSYTRSASF